MIVRALRPEEVPEAHKIQTVSFFDSHDYTKEVTQEEKQQWPEEGLRYRAAFSDDGVMMGVMEVLPYTMLFDGHEVGMAGISSVATLPEYRGQGCIREILRVAMAEMRANEQLLTYLFPFSHPYYRQFGYELCDKSTRVEMRIDQLKRLPVAGTLSAYRKGDSFDPYERIYRAFVSGRNLAILRTQDQWQEKLGKDPYKDRIYTYLWHDGQGAPRGYFQFACKKNKDETTMVIRELAYDGTEALRGILSCLPRFGAQMERLSWDSMPEEVDPMMLTDEPYDIEVTIRRGCMNRIIDVERVLPLLRAPEGAGSLVLGVSDSMLDWNNGSYGVEWADGVLSVKRTDQAPDLDVSVQRLVQLMFGCVSAAQAEALGGVVIHAKTGEAKRLFPVKSRYLNDHF